MGHRAVGSVFKVHEREDLRHSFRKFPSVKTIKFSENGEVLAARETAVYRDGLGYITDGGADMGWILVEGITVDACLARVG
jgi:hypothetical protein